MSILFLCNFFFFLTIHMEMSDKASKHSMVELKRTLMYFVDSLFLTVLRYQRNTVFQCIDRGFDLYFPPLHVLHLRLHGVASPKIAFMVSLRPAPTRPAKPIISPLCEFKACILGHLTIEICSHFKITSPAPDVTGVNNWSVHDQPSGRSGRPLLSLLYFCSYGLAISHNRLHGRDQPAHSSYEINVK